MLNVFACGLFDAKGCEESVWVFLYTFLVPTLLAVGVGLAIVSFLMSAIGFVTSAGDQKATEEATEKLKGSAYGLAVVLLAFLIFQLIVSIVTGNSIPTVSDISGGLKK